ncbi:MAG: tRNA pseudouridine(38-40) synthase TruA, partial [Candidatus Fermentibacteraceae bacterium]|nr:tRNA pseudouridine(38-40) synthase TruA [Candidatus Fermentibacteraceae bacterium]
MAQVRIRLTIEYDGTDFLGWQIQPDSRTVQGEIEDVLRQLCSRKVPIIGSGRTDRGVHALGQVAHTDVNDDELERVSSGLPAMLPDDIAVTAVEVAENTFHARYDAVSRLYRYRVEKEKHPLRCRYCHDLPPSRHPDTGAMKRAAQLSCGENSWKAMAKEGGSNTDWIVSVMEAEVSEDKAGWTFLIRANRFLRGMVRLW